MGKEDESRFGRISRDPRFIRPKKKQTKVEIDSRFSAMMEDPEFEQTQRVDSRGRSNNVLTSKSLNLKKFYQIKNDTCKEDFEQEILEDEPEERANDQIVDRERMARIARGEVLLSSSEDEQEEDKDEDEAGLKDGILKFSKEGLQTVDMSETEFEDILETENVPKGKPSVRFAVVNMDWDNITAMDLLKLFDGFKPSGGFVKSVTIYQSEFGKKRLEKEEREGPPSDIFGKPNLESDIDEDDEDFDYDDSQDNSQKVDDHEQEDEKLFINDENEEFNDEALRKYQLERLRYYYAIVQCDSLQTAKHVFDECDGTEYETSSCFLDLRYVPDEMDFSEDHPKDYADEVPVDYKPREFTTHVLQHSKPKLTWDEDDPSRKVVTQRAFTKDDLKNVDFHAYLASENEEDSEEGEEDEEALRNKYRALLKGSDKRYDKREGEDPCNNGEMEVTFAPGLSNVASKLLDKKKEKFSLKNETVFEQQLREQREKKKAKKLRKKQDAADELVSDVEYSDIENDPFFQDAYGDDFKVGKKEEKSKVFKSKKQTEDEESAKTKADLELLIMDETDKVQLSGKKHFDYDEIVKKEKKSTKKKKSQKKRRKQKGDEEDEEDEDMFKIDTGDSRFEALFTSSQFAIDPTSSKFKGTKAMNTLLEERRKRKVNEDDDLPDSTMLRNSEKKDVSSDLKYLVKKIKKNSFKVVDKP